MRLASAGTKAQPSPPHKASSARSNISLRREDLDQRFPGLLDAVIQAAGARSERIDLFSDDEVVGR
jgi:hypothetical protein